MEFDIESFGYAVLTAIIGMTVVFASLGGLSILMRLLCAIVEPRGIATQTDQNTDADTVVDNSHAKGSTEARRRNSTPLPLEVVLAGAVAHLQYEAREREASAASWSRTASLTSTTAGGWQG